MSLFREHTITVFVSSIRRSIDQVRTRAKIALILAENPIMSYEIDCITCAKNSKKTVLTGDFLIILIRNVMNY